MKEGKCAIADINDKPISVAPTTHCLSLAGEGQKLAMLIYM